MIEISKILEVLEKPIYLGDKDLLINKVVSLDELLNNNEEINLSWCNDKNAYKLGKLKTNSILIVSSLVDNKLLENLNCIIVENPRRAFQEILTKFFVEKRKANISSTAFIHSSSKIGENVFLGHNVVIEENCIIGNNVQILHNTVILKDTIIEDDTVIGANNTIGGVGFGYEKNNNGDFELIPHMGNVHIKNNVEIGNNTCIDRAVLGSTILEENSKIDNLVHIAHGVKIGRNSVVIANAMVAGSVQVGENSWIAPSSSIMNKKEIGNNVLVGMSALVTKNIKDNETWTGNPAKPIQEFIELQKKLKKI